ncbi:hypothetical protein CBS101457_003183 [Exobasidium rhododendri]|nr:hypothetical protein CBS101457_003183 [Exobasidium rhododendri]
MAAISLHPLASRSGVQSATVVTVDLSIDEAQPKLANGKSQLHYAFESSSTAGAASSSPLTTSYADGSAFSLGAESNMSDGHHEEEPAQFWQDDEERLEYGLVHNDIDQYPILIDNDEDDREPIPPIRAMTAKQFAHLQKEYADLDVPHFVVFPFLHGVDGDNVAQNAFFRAPLSGMPTPFYRGLTVIRADMPTQKEQELMNRRRASSSASKLSHANDSNQRSRADSIATTASIFSNDSSSGSEEENTLADLPTSKSSKVAASKSTSSVSSSTTRSDHSRTSSLFSRAMSSDTSASSTCLDSGMYKTSDAAGYSAEASNNRSYHCRPTRHDPQPAHSLLNSSMMCSELLDPPMVAESTATGEPYYVTGATFTKSKQADGISLRNFKTQGTKYASISDIVIYCPAGLHEGVLTLAQWVQQAQESCFRERVMRGLGGLRYNVFVITDSFDAFEREFPHLISVDAGGFSRNRVDFIEREREEMQRFTEATEIDDNVWMGCTANVPYTLEEFERKGSSISLESYLPQEVNPNAFSICIEAIEHADMPTAARLSHAAHYLDAFEATAIFDLNSKEALRELEEEDESDNEVDEDRPYLGPNGWSPSGRNKRGSYKRSMPPSKQQILYPAPDNIIHFKAVGTGSNFADPMEEDEVMESIVNMCIWIKKQSCPNNPKSSSAPHSLLHGALRYGRNSAWPKHQQQFPRRILLHCSDGYTDTSILGLAYLMYAKQLTLPEAYLDMQNRCNRCFFVYARDVPFLQRLSRRLALESKAQMGVPERSRSNGFNWSVNSSNDDISSSQRGNPRRSSSTRRNSNEESSAHLEQSVWARGLAAATGLVTSSSSSGGQPGPKKSNTSLRGGAQLGADTTRTSTPTPRKSTPTPPSPTLDMHPSTASTKPSVQDHRWFTNPNFQGSFPSKILPFLYLGNLSHAMNPAMLLAIGITHVVSVGESALLPPNVEENLVSGAAAAVATSGSQYDNLLKNHRRKKNSGIASTAEQNDSLWEEERRGNISVLDLKDVSDDGIDSIRPHMTRAVEYIEQARLQGGKILVHCRVGVSRSATVCIAYVMAHCDLSMIESFLLVRSRRMNVLTQPTLLFVWEMRGFEAQLAKLKLERRKAAERRQSQEEVVGGNNGDLVMRESTDDGFSLAGLSLSSNESMAMGDHGHHIHYPSPPFTTSPSHDQELQVDIGAGAGSVYGFQVKDCQSRPFNSGSLTRLDYYSAKLTHGYFCKLLSELNARYMVT